MAYDHKRSMRETTDVQMSEETSIDATRIDRALGETTDRFNELEGGDFSETFTKSQFVFGMQPSPIVAVPIANAATPYGPIASINSQSTDVPLCGQWLPWLPIANTKHTTHASVTGVGLNYSGQFNVRGFTPSGGFQNKWRMKGTDVENRPDPTMGVDPLSGSMANRWERTEWGEFWAGHTGTYDDETAEPAPAFPYQFAWSHSWEFPKPVIIDDIMVFIRTDLPWVESMEKYDAAAVQPTGWYDAPYEYRNGGSTLVFSSRDVMFQLSVDNEFAKEERNLNDIEATFNTRPMDGYKVRESGGTNVSYSDMEPEAPGYDTVGGSGDALNGRMLRFSGLNIPIRQFSRVRLSIILPWYAPITAAAFHNDQPSVSRGLSPSRWDAETSPAGTSSKVGFQSPGGNTCLLGAPWDNCSINGCLTILEDVED